MEPCSNRSKTTHRALMKVSSLTLLSLMADPPPCSESCTSVSRPLNLCNYIDLFISISLRFARSLERRWRSRACSRFSTSFLRPGEHLCMWNYIFLICVLFRFLISIKRYLSIIFDYINDHLSIQRERERERERCLYETKNITWEKHASQRVHVSFEMQGHVS